MEIKSAMRRIEEIIANTISGNLFDAGILQSESLVTPSGNLCTYLSASRHPSAPPSMQFSLYIAFKMPEREWSKFCEADNERQEYLLNTLERTIGGLLARRLESKANEIDLGTLSQIQPGPITVIDFDDFGQ